MNGYESSRRRRVVETIYFGRDGTSCIFVFMLTVPLGVTSICTVYALVLSSGRFSAELSSELHSSQVKNVLLKL